VRKGYAGSTPTEQTKLMARCEKRIGNLRHLIDDLLDLGVKRSDLVKTPMHPVDLGEIVEALVNLYREQAAQKNVNFSCEIEAALPPVIAEEKIVDTLFNNLISNALKYTPPGGRVQIRLGRESSDTLRCEVADTGIGISQEDLPRLFTEFHRAENAKHFTEEGTGLGLVIVKEILDRLRGTVSVTSKLGEGTCFTCFLPVAAPSR
jgi:signal transduction histidine kinase